MNLNKMEKLINEISQIHIEDSCRQKKIWQEMFEILSENLEDTIEYLDNVSSLEFSFVCSIFDDLSEHFKSEKFIECIEKNAVRTGVNCQADINCAKEMLK